MKVKQNGNNNDTTLDQSLYPINEDGVRVVDDFTEMDHSMVSNQIGYDPNNTIMSYKQ